MSEKTNPKVRKVIMNSPTPIKSRETMLMARFISNILLKKVNTFNIFLIYSIKFSPQKEYSHLEFRLKESPIARYNLKQYLH